MNEYGFVRVREYDNATGHLVELDAWGAHVLVGLPDAGLTVGHSNRIYLFPSDPDVRDARFDASKLSDKAMYRVAERARSGPALEGKPVAWIDRTKGVSIDVGTSRVGISAGIRSRMAIEVPADSSTTLFFSYGDSNPLDSRIFIQKENE